MCFIIAMIAVNTCLELSPRQNTHDLRKKHLSLVHLNRFGLKMTKIEDSKLKSLRDNFCLYSLFVNRLR